MFLLEREGKIDCKSYWYPKIKNDVILLVDLKPLGTFIEILLVGNKLVPSVVDFQPVI